MWRPTKPGPRIDYKAPRKLNPEAAGLTVLGYLKTKGGNVSSAARVFGTLMHKGLPCKAAHKHVIRFAPPLIIRLDEIDWAFERIEEVLITLQFLEGTL